MLGYGRRPPAGLGRHITDFAPPLGGRYLLTLDSGSSNPSPIQIEIGDGAQQQGFTGTGRSHYRHALAIVDGQFAYLQPRSG
jgi:hypothetical protein